MKAIRMLKKTDAVIALAFAAVAYAPSASALSLITNGSFETGTNPGSFTTLATGSTNITGWTVNGSVDYIGTYWQAADGNRSLDMNGTATGSVSQTVNLDAGKPYLLTFSLAGNPDNAPAVKELQVAISGPGSTSQTFTFDITGKTKAAMGWVSKELLYTTIAGGAYTFTFSSLNTGSFGPALDNVSLTAVPLPAAAWLFISALGGLVLIGRRRRMHGAAA